MGISGGNIWADLPIEILDEMLTKLPDIEDSIRFCCVSRSWRSASVESKSANKSCGPWLMLSEPQPRENFINDDETFMMITMFKEEEEDSNKDKDDIPLRRFFNLSTNKTIELYLPEAQGRRCWGSNYGWLLTIGADLDIHLLNPLTRLQISLPPQPTFRVKHPKPTSCDFQYPNGQTEGEYLRFMYLEKFALSSHPNRQHCVVMVIYSHRRKLAFTRPGDTAWTDVKCPGGEYEDVIFYNNLFYAVYHGGHVVVCDITRPVPVAKLFMPPPILLKHSYRYYLVEMAGDLHLVLRRFKSVDKCDRAFVFATEFRVYKLDFCRKKWIKLLHLGDHALFVGNNASFALSHPQLRSNCIYFSDDHMEYYDEGNCDLGLFDFGEKKMLDPIYSGDCLRSTFCAPLFFIPSLY